MPTNAEAVVSVDSSGRLTYQHDEAGNRIPDFSNCGYQGGGIPLPDVDAVEVILPQVSGDDTRRIQAAINHVASIPEDEDGFKGAVLLKHGTYRIAKSIHILSSGIVLRGEGQEADGTTLIATGKGQRSLIEVGSVRTTAPRGLEQLGHSEADDAEQARSKILDEIVPVGARSFRVASVDAFSIGDEIIVHRPSTAEWIHEIGMDQIEVKDENTHQWEPGSYDMRFRRAVVGIDGDRISIDAPLVQAIESRFGGGSIYRYFDLGRIERVGVENIRGISEFDDSIHDKRHAGEYADEDHGWNLITVNHARDGWVRDVTSVHFGYSCVYLQAGAHRFTVQDCSCLDPVSLVTGSRRYSFAIAGQMNLVQRCRTRRGRHDYVLHARAQGPNAFVDCVAEQAFSDTGPHHRWSVGTLFDNVKVEGNAINVQDRQASGTGHGWAGAMKVLWNCEADSIVCQKPPTSQNYAIGCIAEKQAGWHEREDGHWESHGSHVEPRHLYLSQLEERLKGS
jgi:hypothetical protein